MIEVDVAIVGSGVSAIKSASVAKALGRSYLAVDSTYGRGGYVQVVGRVYRYLKSPLFIPQKLVDVFRSAGGISSIRCYGVDRYVVREGNVESKILGYRSITVQRNWFTEWLEQRELCYSSSILYSIESLLGVSLLGKSIVSSIRRIDLDRSIIALSNGVLIKFRKLVYTWPLNLLPRYIHSEKISRRVVELIEMMNLDYISTYTLSCIAREVGIERVELYTHGTRASRFHTAVKIPIDHATVTYITTSYSSSHPLIPGATEKLYSEIRRHRLVDTSKILEFSVTETIHALINQVDRKLLNELQQNLYEYGVILYGRLGSWRDCDLYTIIAEEAIAID